ncbi:MAG: biopolymer transporter ExbD [Pseudomonadota bacterium]
MAAATPTRLARPRRRRSLIGLTPLIDVVFILLIFFMLASNFLRWRAIDLSAPVRAAATVPVEQDVLKIEILMDGMTIDGASITMTQFDQQVSDRLAQDRDLTIVIQPDVGVPLQRTVSTLDRLRSLGASKLNLVRDPQAAGL